MLHLPFIIDFPFNKKCRKREGKNGYHTMLLNASKDIGRDSRLESIPLPLRR